jgi:hypothetical protein
LARSGLENLYEHEGAQALEFVLAANIRLNDASYYQRPQIDLVEDGSFAWMARWFDPSNLPDGVPLYPEGLAERLAPPISWFQQSIPATICRPFPGSLWRRP